MAQKTFCDRCKEEIPIKRLHRVTHELTLTRLDEDHLGNQTAEETLKAELCSSCRQSIGSTLTIALRK
jgi:hypothetical protein